MQFHQAPATQAPPSPQEGAPSRPLMESMPKKWVMQPLSPRLEPADLRTVLHSREESSQDSTWTCSEMQGLNDSLTSVTWQEEHDVLERPQRVQVSEGSYRQDHHPSSPTSISSNSSTGTCHGFYSFMDEDVEKTEAWMVSPERQNKLATVKEANGFKVQAYSEKKPEKLFQDGEGDSFSQVAAVPATVQDDLEQVQERLELIRSQAPKRKPVDIEQWEALENLDLSKPPQRVLDGLSLYYIPSRADRETAKAESGTIDTEKINFNIARQQFLTMEQSRSNPFQNVPQEPYQSANKGQPPQAEGGLVMLRRHDYESLTGEKSTRSQNQESNSIKNDLFGSKCVTVYTSEETAANQSCCNEKLGRGFMLPPGHVSDQYAFVGQEYGQEPQPLDEAETPIEKEIRLAQEREESLRRERGIKHTNLKEMVEIKTKPFLSRTGPTGTPTKTRDKGRVSFFLQREIELDNQREEKLHHQGRAPALHNHDTPQELGERKKVFEQQADEVPVTPPKTSITGNHLDATQVNTGAAEALRTPEYSTPAEWRRDNKTEDVLSPCCPHRHPEETAQWILNNSTVPDSYSPSPFTPSTPTDLRLLWPSLTGRYIVPQADFHEKFSLRPHKVDTPEAILKEIEQDIKREEELRLLRGGSSLPQSQDEGPDNADKRAPSTGTTFMSPESKSWPGLSSPWGLRATQATLVTTKASSPLPPPSVSSFPSIPAVTAQPWSSTWPDSPGPARVPALKTQTLRSGAGGTAAQKGLTETLLEDRSPRLKLEESVYAGIHPTDDVNWEVLEATRVTRHKNMRALRWEAGVFANKD
ncbi:mitotic interactor and substrate of PLK1 [Brienomyrus brachyistius]|uniref:mitotic interactor and substrate of PLK1 n=1 Tax=Brienomyrus brachyistius TaxID=42636 RepID=UPI0020B32984|nr:mitotic interactor and substrate of PLK1 [Brienomyrus brachyistius]